MLPVVTNIGLEIPFLFTGAIVDRDDLLVARDRQATIDATREFDYPTLMGILLITAIIDGVREPDRRHRLRGRRPADQVLRFKRSLRHPGPGRGRSELDAPRSTNSGADYEVNLESLSQWQLAWRKFKTHRLALIGLGILLVALRRRDRRPDPDAVRLQRDPAAGRQGLCRPAAVAPALVRGDRRPPARRLHARRQRGADLAPDRLLEHVHRRVHRHDRRIDRRLSRRVRRQPPDADRRRDAEPAAALRDPRREPVLRRTATSA